MITPCKKFASVFTSLWQPSGSLCQALSVGQKNWLHIRLPVPCSHDSSVWTWGTRVFHVMCFKTRKPMSINFICWLKSLGLIAHWVGLLERRDRGTRIQWLRQVVTSCRQIGAHLCHRRDSNPEPSALAYLEPVLWLTALPSTSLYR